ncbi:MAG: hypothetical protein Q8S13_09855, partial [Dehalococcoidia bacterium]|nr:hypothetical protein [Dehalococcoidia bacterium]
LPGGITTSALSRLHPSHPSGGVHHGNGGIDVSTFAREQQALRSAGLMDSPGGGGGGGSLDPLIGRRSPGGGGTTTPGGGGGRRAGGGGGGVTSPRPPVTPRPHSSLPGNAHPHQHQQHHRGSTSADAGLARVGSARPASSSLSISERLRALPPATGNYHRDIERVIRVISETDFPKDAPYPELALAQVASLPTVDERIATLRMGSAGGATARSDSARSSGSGASPLSSARRPWKPVIGYDYFLPAPPTSWKAKFDDEYQRHVMQDLPKLVSSPKRVDALYDGRTARDTFQAKELERIAKDMREKRVDRDVSPENARKVVEKLGVADVAHRRKEEQERETARAKQSAQEHSPPPAETAARGAADENSAASRQHLTEKDRV